MNGALVAGGSPITLQSMTEDISITINGSNTSNNDVAVTQNIEILVTSNGYSPNYFRVKKGSPVTVQLTSRDAYSCASSFRIPSLGISKNLQPNQTDSVEFTPQDSGKIAFSCSMGMYHGVIEVI